MPNFKNPLKIPTQVVLVQVTFDCARGVYFRWLRHDKHGGMVKSSGAIIPPEDWTDRVLRYLQRRFEPTGDWEATHTGGSLWLKRKGYWWPNE